MHAPQFYCLTFGAEPASGLAQSSAADQPRAARPNDTALYAAVTIRAIMLGSQLIPQA